MTGVQTCALPSVVHTGFLLTARRLAAGSGPLTRRRPPARGAYDEAGHWEPRDVGERTGSAKKLRRVLRDAAAKRPGAATPVLSGAPAHGEGEEGGARA